MLLDTMYYIYYRGYELATLWGNQGVVPLTYLTIALSLLLTNVRQDFERNVLYHTTTAMQELTRED